MSFPTVTMNEIPFLQHVDPLTLNSTVCPSSSTKRQRRRYTVSATAAPNGGYLLSLELATNSSIRDTRDNDGQRNNDNVVEGHQQSNEFLRGLVSTFYSKLDNKLICTNGVPGKRGRVRIAVCSIADGSSDSLAGGMELQGHAGDMQYSTHVELDLGHLMRKENANEFHCLFDTPVGAACFVTHQPRINSHQIDDSSKTDKRHKNNNIGDKNDMDIDQDSTTVESYLLFRTLDTYGTVLSITLSYPDLEPLLLENYPLHPSYNISKTNSSSVIDRSFLLQFHPPIHQTPHPGSFIDINQVCFPTPTSVVFALNPHLYCLDFGTAANSATADSQGTESTNDMSYCNVVTRVWSDIHQIVSDPIYTSLGKRREKVVIHPTPRKKVKQSLGTILTKASYTLVGMAVNDWDLDGDHEYSEDGRDEKEKLCVYRSVPSIAALTCLVSNGTEEVTTAKVATIHSDGSLRIWVATPSKKIGIPSLQALWTHPEEFNDEKKQMMNNLKPKQCQTQLRIPSVQRIALPSRTKDGLSYSDPPVPNPSLWNGFISLCGHVKSAGDSSDGLSYELALYLHCFTLDPSRETKSDRSVYLFQGLIVDANTHVAKDNYGLSPSNDCVQELKLPADTHSVVDLSWSMNRELLVLCRRANPMLSNALPDSTSFIDGDDHKMALVLYPLGSNRFAEPLMPDNTSLPYLDLNHFGQSFGLSVEEELDRFLIRSKFNMQVNDEISGNLQGKWESIEEQVAEVEDNVDKAGVLCLLEPLGRRRPYALAVSFALSALDLIDGEKKLENITSLTIVQVMQEWKKKDASPTSSTKATTSLILKNDTMDLVVQSPIPPTTNNSIYLAFASATRKTAKAAHRESLDGDGDRYANHDVEISIEDAVEDAQRAHILRWVKLLTEIRRQETKLNEVLCFASVTCAPSGYNFVVRSSMSSIIAFDDSYNSELSLNNEEDLMAQLDEFSLEVLEIAMSVPKFRNCLRFVESYLYDAASKGNCLLLGWRKEGMENELVKQCGALVCSMTMKLKKNDQQKQLLRILLELDYQFAEVWLSSYSSKSQLVRAALTLTNEFKETPKWIIGSGDGGDVDVQSSAALSISAQIESIRQLYLARLLLVHLSQTNSSPFFLNAMRASLYCNALSWSINQPSSNDRTRTVLEKQLQHCLNMRGTSMSGLLTASYLSNALISDFFRFIKEEPSTSLYMFSPSQEPQILLRLLCPLVEYSSQAYSSEQFTLNQMRTYLTADCLLTEVSKGAKRTCLAKTETQPQHLWKLASNMLLGTVTTDSFDTSKFCDVFQGLRGDRSEWWSFSDNPSYEFILIKFMTIVLRTGSREGRSSNVTETQDEIKRLCKMQTIKSLFLPSILSLYEHGVAMDQNFLDRLISEISQDIVITRLTFYHFVKSMLHISNLLFCTEKLEHHLHLMDSDNIKISMCSNITLETIYHVISVITSDLPPEMSQEMPELSYLWSNAFQTSMRGNLWEEAYRACISNPIDDLKKQNFKSFILGMIDAKALGKLIDMSMTVVVRDDPRHDAFNGLDFFELAVDTLQRAAQDQASVFPRSTDEVDALLKDHPNYWGALYSLHASRGNWKEAAEAMQMFGEATVAYISNDSLILTKDMSKIIMDNISMSAQACHHAMSLVEKKSHKYIMTEKQGKKRLLTEEDIERQAIRAVALRAVSMDEYFPDSVTNILKATTHDTIEIIARLGYYDYAISLAKGLSSKRKSRPGGVDLFDNALKYIFSKYLIPAAIKTSNETEVENSGNMDVYSRPTIAQIRSSSFSCLLGSSYTTQQIPVTSYSSYSTSYMRNENRDVALEVDMAMKLLRQYTIIYSRSCSGLALHVAHSMFQANGGESDLPYWLKNLCMYGITVDDSHASSFTSDGLFAQTNNVANIERNVSDPAGLVRLYMKYHKYEDACGIVISILERSTMAVSCDLIPEKGRINYVPYDMFDDLWSTIQNIVEKHSNDENVKCQIQSLLLKRSNMENELVNHFESLKFCEDGLKSARVLAH